MPGRTVSKHSRVYVSGYDMSGYTRSIGPLTQTFDEVDATAMADVVKGVLPGHGTCSVGTLNAMLDNTPTSGLHVIANNPGVRRVVTVAIGDRAAPALGVPTYSVETTQLGYQATDDGGLVAVTIPFSDGEAADGSGGQFYPNPWGVLLNANLARTAVNAATGVDNGAASTFGGVMVYHITAGNGTATLSVEDSADNAAWAAVAGMSTGLITMAAGVSGAVAIARTATIRRYARWQLVFGTATSVTFVQSLIRGTF